MALMHLTIIPLGTGSPSLGEYIADIIQVLDAAGFAYELTDMGTVVEGSTPELLDLAARLSELPFSRGAERVATQISLDDRRDGKIALGDKTRSAARRLAERGR